MTHRSATTNHTAGYTLVELLIYFGLVSLLFLQLTSLFITLLESRSNITALTSIERDGQYLLARLGTDIRAADSITTPANLGETTTSLGLTIDGQQYLYQVTDETLTLTRDSQAFELHDKTQVSEFSVTRLGNVGGNHSVQVEFRVTSPILEARGNQSQVFQTAVGTR